MCYGSSFRTSTGSGRARALLALAGWLSVCVHGAAPLAAPPETGIDLELAASHFAEARAISDRDGGDTWGRPLFGPMLLVDRATRELVANVADGHGALQRADDLFIGRLPDEVNCANTAVDWAGVHWTMMLWPLPEDSAQRARLMMHESFHRIQDKIGLSMANPDNAHLDTREGRIWLQLEWRALHRALGSDGESRRTAVRDALSFRTWRQRLFDGAADGERALELNEGLAEYTGIRTAHPEKRRTVVARSALDAGPGKTTFMRSFAYVSGPAYGLLLDQADPHWRSSLDQASDLGALLAQAWKIDLPETTEAGVQRAAQRYDASSLIDAETERDRSRQAQAELDRRRLIEGPILMLTLTEDTRYSFNPGNLRALGGVGTVYPTLRVTDRWGILDVDGGALMTRAEGRASGVHVPSPRHPPDGQRVVGDGWILTLEPGWSLEAADRPGDYRLRSHPD